MVLLIIGVALILVGGVIAYELGPEPLIRVAAVVLVIGGLILAVIGIIDLAGASDAHAAPAQHATYGRGHPQHVAQITDLRVT